MTGHSSDTGESAGEVTNRDSEVVFPRVCECPYPEVHLLLCK
jgi:hypothetical protein